MIICLSVLFFFVIIKFLTGQYKWQVVQAATPGASLVTQQNNNPPVLLSFYFSPHIPGHILFFTLYSLLGKIASYLFVRGMWPERRLIRSRKREVVNIITSLYHIYGERRCVYVCVYVCVMCVCMLVCDCMDSVQCGDNFSPTFWSATFLVINSVNENDEPEKIRTMRNSQK